MHARPHVGVRAVPSRPQAEAAQAEAEARLKAEADASAPRAEAEASARLRADEEEAGCAQRQTAGELRSLRVQVLTGQFKHFFVGCGRLFGWQRPVGQLTPQAHGVGVGLAARAQVCRSM
jgi:hypothetical protein